MKKIFSLVTLSMSIFISIRVNAQDKDTTKKSCCTFKVTTDLVSTYIWRGTIGSRNPNFQPTFAVDAGNLEIGAWGSTDFIGTYKEVDPYISYTLAKVLKLTVTDYDWNFKTRYFDYNNKTTDHIFEGSIGYVGTEKFPLSITLNTMFYGSDKKWDKDSSKFSTNQNYSTYIELGYTFKDFSVFAGVTPWNSYYGAGYGKVDGFNVVNIGISSTRTIKVSKDFELPLKGTLIINPQSQDIHLVLGLTL